MFDELVGRLGDRGDDQHQGEDQEPHEDVEKQTRILSVYRSAGYMAELGAWSGLPDDYFG